MIFIVMTSSFIPSYIDTDISGNPFGDEDDDHYAIFINILLW